jgi:hypothetical protein
VRLIEEGVLACASVFFAGHSQSKGVSSELIRGVKKLDPRSAHQPRTQTPSDLLLGMIRGRLKDLLTVTATAILHQAAPQEDGGVHALSGSTIQCEPRPPRNSAHIEPCLVASGLPHSPPMGPLLFLSAIDGQHDALSSDHCIAEPKQYLGDPRGTATNQRKPVTMTHADGLQACKQAALLFVEQSIEQDNGGIEFVGGETWRATE